MTGNDQRGFDARVTKTESSVEWMRGEIQAIKTRIEEIGTRGATEIEKLQTTLGSQINGIRTEFDSTRRPNWQLLISSAFLILALWGAAMVPLWQSNAANTASIAESKEWQKDWTRGAIPSPTAPRIAAVEQRFVEVETQFRAFKDRMVENETVRAKTDDRLQEVMDHNHTLIDKLREDLSTLMARLPREKG